MATPRNPLETFIWGSGGRAMTPEQVAREREIAAALTDQGADFSPVGHWLQGAARLGHSAAGAFRNWRADEAETAGRGALSDRWSSVFGGGASPVAEALSDGVASPALDAANAVAAMPTGDMADRVRSGLMERGLPEHVANAFILNMQDESGLNPGINEAAPIVPGSRGGFGLYQLTGPRRTAYEAFAGERGVDPSDVDAQLDWLMHELQGPEAAAAQSILSAQDTPTAAVAILNDFLRPAEEHRERRANAYMSGGQPTQVASIDPGFLVDIPSGAGRIDPGIFQDIPADAGDIDPGFLRPPPQSEPSQFLPQSATPGSVMTGPDGRNYMYAETTGMAGATGENGWIPYSGGAQPSQAGGTPSIAELLSLSGDPNFGYASPAQQQIVQALMGQQLQQQDPAYQQQMVLRDLEMQQLQQQMNAPNLMNVGGQLYNPDTGEWIAPPSGPAGLVEVGGVLYDPETRQPVFDSRAPSTTTVDGVVVDTRTGQPIYESPQGRPYEVINGEVVYLDPQAGTATSAGQFGAPDPGWRALTADEAATYGIPAGTPAQINEGTGEVKGLGGVNVTTNVGDPEFGPTPAGYQLVRAPEGARLERIPGGPQEEEKVRDAEIAAETAERALGNIQSIVEDPNLGLAVGLGGFLPAIPNTPQAGLVTRINQLQGTAFLQAFETLRGGGQISNVEGQKAQEAIARLNRVQSQEDFINALNDLGEVVHTGLNRARREAGMESLGDFVPFKASGGDSGQTGQSVADPSIFPAPGTVEDGYRFKGGDPANPDNWERVR